MPSYRKKPIVLEAFQYNTPADFQGALPAWLGQALNDRVVYVVTSNLPEEDPRFEPPYLMVNTNPDGGMRVAPGDWIIQGAQGELYPCKPDAFAASYDAVD